jgi:2-polyprenyl-3-methyl-5-hydroxy-6-metoxy-1,4-benzoquinol methylase
MSLSPKKEVKMFRESVFWESIKHQYSIWHFIRYKRVVDIVNNIEGKFLLDVGCGIGLLDFLIANREIIGVDIDRKSLKDAIRVRENYKLKRSTFFPLVADLHAPPFKEKFDVVVCLEVLEHLPDDKRALAALLSVLKEDGFLIITLPNALRIEFPQLFRLALRPKDLCPEHLREYQVNNVHESLLESFPLEIEKMSGVYLDFPLFHILNLPIRPFSSIQFSTKFRFFAYKALFRIYTIFWTGLEKLFWRHAYYILIISRKSSAR